MHNFWLLTLKFQVKRTSWSTTDLQAATARTGYLHVPIFILFIANPTFHQFTWRWTNTLIHPMRWKVNYIIFACWRHALLWFFLLSIAASRLDSVSSWPTSNTKWSPILQFIPKKIDKKIVETERSCTKTY